MKLLVLLLCLLAFGGGALAAVAALHGDEAAGVVDRVQRVTGRDVPAVSCPSSAEGDCVEVRGRVVLIEAVDPDGDGDLHVVVAGGGYTGAGVTSIDVKPSLRPERDPKLGEVVSAAGPIQRGSFGQRQLHALRFAS